MHENTKLYWSYKDVVAYQSNPNYNHKGTTSEFVLVERCGMMQMRKLEINITSQNDILYKAARGCSWITSEYHLSKGLRLTTGIKIPRIFCDYACSSRRNLEVYLNEAMAFWKFRFHFSKYTYPIVKWLLPVCFYYAYSCLYLSAHSRTRTNG